MGLDEVLRDVMRREGIHYIWCGSDKLIARAAKEAGAEKKTKSKTTAAVLAACENSELFEKSYVYMKRGKGKHRCRLFRLKGSVKK